jgi:hypothetical protein
MRGAAQAAAEGKAEAVHSVSAVVGRIHTQGYGRDELAALDRMAPQHRLAPGAYRLLAQPALGKQRGKLVMTPFRTKR